MDVETYMYIFLDALSIFSDAYKFDSRFDIGFIPKITLQTPKSNPKLYEACVARGDGDEALRIKTNGLTQAIADYKQASKTVRGLENQSKPKGKAKAKAKAES